VTPIDAEFKNDAVRVSVHRKPFCRVEFEVHASASLIHAARRAAAKAVSKEISLPGFRKGKAPEELILRNYGPQVEKELQKQLADLAYIEAQKLAQVPLLNSGARITFDLKHINDQGADLRYSFETEPQVPPVDIKQFVRKEVKRPEVSEKQIEEAIRQMMFFYAEWKPVEERPIQDGDYIMIDLDTIDGETPQKVFHHIRFEVSKERMAGWMKQLVQGAKAGDVLEGMSEPDDTASEEEKKEFKPKKVRLSILKVEQAVLPELNDEFAKKVGAETVEAMRVSVAEILNSQADQKVRAELREQVNDYLVTTYPFELPQSLVQTEKQHRIDQLMRDPKFKGSWNQMSAEERASFEEKVSAESAQAVRLFYLSRQIVNQEKIPIAHKEIQDEAVATLQSFGNHSADKVTKELYALALSKVILAKAQDAVLAEQKA
jgi:trigger factor